MRFEIRCICTPEEDSADCAACCSTASMAQSVDTYTVVCTDACTDACTVEIDANRLTRRSFCCAASLDMSVVPRWKAPVSSVWLKLTKLHEFAELSTRRSRFLCHSRCSDSFMNGRVTRISRASAWDIPFHGAPISCSTEEFNQ
jgi:hypothetical protein